MPYGRRDRGRRPASASPGPKTSISATAAIKADPPVPASKGEVLGLDMEDTVAQYETLDGRTVVEPSNEVLHLQPAIRRRAASGQPDGQRRAAAGRRRS